MTTEQGYNGWKNYETWVTALWISNDEGTYNYSRWLTEQAYEDGTDASQVESGIWTADEARRFALEETLKDWVSDELLPDLGATLGADLLGAALSEVDWLEIAENYLSDYEPDEVDA